MRAQHPWTLYPLRKVVRAGLATAGSPDALECGHELPAARDIYGPRFPTARRCRQCWVELTPEQQAARRAAQVERLERQAQLRLEREREYRRPR